MNDFIVRFSKIFIIILIVYSIIAICDDLNGIMSGKSFLSDIRLTANALVFINSFFLAVFLIFTSVLPLKFFLPPLIIFIFKGIVIFPLSFYTTRGLDFEQKFSYDYYNILNYAKWYGAILVLFTLTQLFFAFYLKLNNDKIIYNKKAVFNFKRPVVSILSLIVIFSVFAGPYFMLNITSFVNNLTNGFLKADSTSFYSVEKIYSKNNTDISLLGMIHIGDKEFYEKLSKNIVGNKKLLLPEGISDKNDLLKIKPDYKNLSKSIGLNTQAENFKIEKDSIDIKNVDIDTSEFDEKTITIINSILKVLESKSRAEVNQNLVYSNEVMREYNGMFYIKKDIIDKRNDKIIDAIDKYSKEYNHIIVPWGALHLDAIEKHLIENNYVIKNTITRKVFDFITIFENIIALKGKV
ncbi:MAG: hypothetical protein M0R46_01355 [Candidatus Muirbacterium halophilum]|nr:hypothetical protein [Candidatus Muirbacterium halophilum]